MMQVNMLWVYITVPLAGLFWFIFASYRLWQVVGDYRRRDQDHDLENDSNKRVVS